MLLLGPLGHGAWVLLSLRPYSAIGAIHDRGVELVEKCRADPSRIGGGSFDGKGRGIVL